MQIVQALLAENGIKSIAMNKKDRAYLFGNIELYVHPDNVIRALQIINKESL